MEENNIEGHDLGVCRPRIVSPFEFIIQPKGGKAHVHNIGQGGLILNTNFDDASSSNRIGVIESIPPWYDGDMTEGDEIIVHHNVFRKYNDFKGDERFSQDFFGHGYTCPIDAIFAFRRDGSDWKCIDENIFVLPKKEENVGVVDIVGDDTSHLKGVEIMYTPHSKYAFYIEGVKYFKMKKHNVCLVKE